MRIEQRLHLPRPGLRARQPDAARLRFRRVRVISGGGSDARRLRSRSRSCRACRRLPSRHRARATAFDDTRPPCRRAVRAHAIAALVAARRRLRSPPRRCSSLPACVRRRDDRCRRVAAPGGLAHALRLLRESARRPVPDRRRAADYVARAAARRGSDSAADAIRLAWSAPDPQPPEVAALADRVEATTGATRERDRGQRLRSFAAAARRSRWTRLALAAPRGGRLPSPRSPSRRGAPPGGDALLPQACERRRGRRRLGQHLVGDLRADRDDVASGSAATGATRGSSSSRTRPTRRCRRARRSPSSAPFERFFRVAPADDARICSPSRRGSPWTSSFSAGHADLDRSLARARRRPARPRRAAARDSRQRSRRRRGDLESLTSVALAYRQARHPDQGGGAEPVARGRALRRAPAARSGGQIVGAGLPGRAPGRSAADSPARAGDPRRPARGSARARSSSSPNACAGGRRETGRCRLLLLVVLAAALAAAAHDVLAWRRRAARRRMSGVRGRGCPATRCARCFAARR